MVFCGHFREERENDPFFFFSKKITAHLPSIISFTL